MRDKRTHKDAASPQPETPPQAAPAFTFTQPPQTPQKTAGNSLFVGPRKPAMHTTLQLKTPAPPPAKTVAATTKVEVARQENEGGPPPAKDVNGNVA